MTCGTERGVFILRICFFVFILSGLQGCAPVAEETYPFGESSKTLFAAQVINPNAPEDPSPVNEMPGQVSELIYYQRYMDEMVTPEDEEEKSSGGTCHNG